MVFKSVMEAAPKCVITGFRLAGFLAGFFRRENALPAIGYGLRYAIVYVMPCGMEFFEFADLVLESGFVDRLFDGLSVGNPISPNFWIQIAGNLPYCFLIVLL